MKNARPNPTLLRGVVCELIDQSNYRRRRRPATRFQTKIAPLIFLFLPQRLRIGGLKNITGYDRKFPAVILMVAWARACASLITRF